MFGTRHVGVVGRWTSNLGGLAHPASNGATHLTGSCTPPLKLEPPSAAPIICGATESFTVELGSVRVRE